MNKLEEIYQKNWEERWEGMTYQSFPELQKHIFASMKEYAEHYGQQCLEKAAKAANIMGGLNEGFRVDRESITSITLPEHE